MSSAEQEGEGLSDWRSQEVSENLRPGLAKATEGGPRLQRLRRVLRRTLWLSRHRREE